MIDSSDILSILVPTKITSGMILSTNVTPEDASPAWSSAATYAVGDRVHLPSTHTVYESARAGNTAKDPSEPVNRFDAAGAVTWWIEVGPTNQFAMFDGAVSTKTSRAGGLTVTLQPGYFNAFALFGVETETVHVVVRDAPGGNILYEYDGPLDANAPSDYYEHFFDPYRTQTQFIATDIPAYTNMVIELTLSTATTARLGMLALGDARPIGAPLRGASVEPIDYSYVAIDDFGNNVIRKRSNATSLSIPVKIDIADANSVMDTLKEVLGQPVVVIGSQARMYESLTVFGLVSSRMSYNDYNEPLINLTVKGLI